MKNQIIIHSSGNQTRIALLENNELAQLFIETEENQRTVGNIYVARVHKVLSGIRAAFIDMGTPKDAFLHFSDAGDHLDEYITKLNGSNAIPGHAKKDIENKDNLSNVQKQILAGKMLRTGQKLLVQIVKEPIGSKGPRISTDITIAGRFLVLIPMGDYIAVSKKIGHYKERRRLKGILNNMIPDGFGVIVRTVAQGQDKEALEDDLRNVLKKWEQIVDKLEDAKPPSLLYRDLNMTESLIRDLFAKNYDRVLIDDPEMYRQIKSYVGQIAPQMVPNVELYKGKEHIFDFMKIAHDVNSIFSPRVRMKSGGYLIFEQTEAMYVVDVNSGPYAAKKKQEDNSLKTNLEAAREVAKQLRLRDIGGIIVVDFIDLRDDKNRKKIYDELKKEFVKDPAKTNVIGMSDFGLVQITRQRIRPSVVNSVSKVCPVCGGSGNVVTQDTILTDLETWLSKFKHNTNYRAVDLYVNPFLKSVLTKGLMSTHWKWMAKFRIKISLIGDETVSMNEFRATLVGSDIDITDIVMRDESIEEVLDREGELIELESGKGDKENLDISKKERSNSSRSSGRNDNSNGRDNSKYYKSSN
ncbi:MAG: Rne/Rng family ribonuclease [Gracilimonas sp.]|uniref:Rne/Rng family ribonuclease n=1 Tax=Gracilimonas sediminicola TaxID=2952158 RepID=A0A9X2RCP7_9BACT|nr:MULTISPECIES: Rne/Rng family ribonuclease [Gracilimonas]MBO6586083.1 Rne/Rng family ribonuclease [Gracilimonas sp.]MBO6614740.1 Rne/Rng family ribonuclease [Gracilimonas sp.]MCP9290097.1 Rne/Rng family ribonuclease [Gracilimonas sediminicola]